MPATGTSGVRRPEISIAEIAAILGCAHIPETAGDIVNDDAQLQILEGY